MKYRLLQKLTKISLVGLFSIGFAAHAADVVTQPSPTKVPVPDVRPIYRDQTIVLLRVTATGFAPAGVKESDKCSVTLKSRQQLMGDLIRVTNHLYLNKSHQIGTLATDEQKSLIKGADFVKNLQVAVEKARAGSITNRMGPIDGPTQYYQARIINLPPPPPPGSVAPAVMPAPRIIELGGVRGTEIIENSAPEAAMLKLFIDHQCR